ncbi:hypothetical protein D031_1965A, partial [Vibrio parahaemolyticus VP-48]
MAGLHT